MRAVYFGLTTLALLLIATAAHAGPRWTEQSTYLLRCISGPCAPLQANQPNGIFTNRDTCERARASSSDGSKWVCGPGALK